MIHIAKSLAIKLWLIFIPSIAIMALSLVVFSQWLPNLSQYRASVENWVSKTINRPVRLEQLSARWQGIGPELVLTNLEVLPASKATEQGLKLSEVRINLALIESILALEIRPRRITLSDVRLPLRLEADTSLSIAGLERLEPSNKQGGLMGIPYQITIEESEIIWENRLTGIGPLRYTGVNAMLVNASERHQFNATIPLPGDTAKNVELKVDLTGDASLPGGWIADLYLKGEQLPLVELLRPHEFVGLSAKAGYIDLEAWARWDGEHFTRVSGQLDGRDLKLENIPSTDAPAPPGALKLERLSGDFQWRSQIEGWHLDVARIEFERGGRSWPESQISVQAQHDEHQHWQLMAGAEFARVEDVAAIFGVLPLSIPKLHENSRAIDPQSDLHDLKIRYQQGEQSDLWSVRGRFDSLATRPWKHAPGVLDLDGQFWINQEKGALLLDSRGTELEFPKLFRNPLKLKQLRGALTWAREDDGSWRLDTRQMIAVTRDIKTQTRFSIDIPADSGQSLYMDLQTDFRDGLAINAHHYYPVGIMPPAVVQWLDRSIVEGDLVYGSALVRGPLSDFPFHRTRNGRFEVFFRGQGMTIDYWPGWPRLTEIAANVRFLNNSFDAWIEDGRILDSRLAGAHGSIENLSGSSPFTLNGSVSGPMQDTLRILRESPLAADYAAFTEGLRGDGEVITEIDMRIPIDPSEEFSLNGSMEFGGSILHLEEWHLPLTGIQGRLGFTHERIDARGIRAYALGSDIVIHATTLDTTTRIEAQGDITSQMLIKRLPQLELLPFSGNSNWVLQLDLPHHKDDTNHASLKASSNLLGTSIELPAPFGKAQSQTSELRLTTRLGVQTPQPVRIAYDDLLEVLYLTADEQLVKAGVQLGGDPAILPETPGIEIYGRLDSLDLVAWASAIGGRLDNGTDSELVLRRIDLEIDRVALGELALETVDADFHLDRERWSGSLSSRRLEGEIEIPVSPSKSPIRARLQRLEFTFDPEQLSNANTGSEERAQAAVIEPVSLPALDIEVEKVKINEHDFGSMQMVTRHTSNGLEMATFSLDSDLAQISATGSWTGLPSESRQMTDFELSLNTVSAGDLLEKLGFSRNIDGARAKITAHTNWPDAPHRYRTETVKGEIGLLLESGRFIEVNPGVGRIFGLLNITAVQRRLRLDFSDLTQKGLAFDQIDGDFVLVDGDAYTSNLSIRGPAAQIDILGRTGLVSEDFDQQVTVTPRVSGALPVAGFLAGGPIGGAAMLVAQGLLGDEFDKASRRTYEVRGPWDDPVFTPYGTTLDAASAVPVTTPVTETTPPPDEQSESAEATAVEIATPKEPEKQQEAPPKTESKGLLNRLKKTLKPREPTFEEPQKGVMGID